MHGPNLVIINANVITLGESKPRAEAIAIRDGVICDVDSTERILRHVSDETRVLDLQGRTVVPGLIDSHVHMLGFGLSLRQLDLSDVRSIGELKARLRNYAENRPKSGWILGGKWDQERLSEKRYPSRWDLDAAVSDMPVFLLRICGHIGVVNSKALGLAGINKVTETSESGIDKDGNTGEPNGIVRERALEFIWRVIPKPSFEEIEDSSVLACQKAVEAGLTGVNWLLSSADELRVIQKLCFEDRLPIRVYLGFPVRLLSDLIKLGLVTDFGNDMVKIGFVKVLADGSLGGHTAALNEPYSDIQDTRGMILYTQRKLNNIILRAHEAGLQVAVHAIGDRAVDMSLKAFERALKSLPRKDHRHRIEHCSVLNPNLIQRMKCLGVIASVQPHFIISDFWVISRVGEKRARWVYPFRSLLHSGIVAAAGSDSPVEPIDPLLGMWAAVTRNDPHSESISVEEALKMHTLYAAYASFCEGDKGSIEAGKLADLAILSEDPYAISQERIKNISVEMVIIKGKIVYKEKNLPSSENVSSEG